jgi:PilZ domain
VIAAFGRAKGGGRRGAERSVAALAAVLMTVTSTQRTTLVDLSCTGARLRGDGLPPEGDIVELKIETVRVFGIVAWSNETECGIEFDAPLVPFEVENLRRKAGLVRLAGLSIDDRLALDDWLFGLSR